MTRSTAARIIDEGRRLIMTRGYNGFSYADVAAAIGIRKASIHHHFPGKNDLAVAVVGQSRTAIAAQVGQLADTGLDAAAARMTFFVRCFIWISFLVATPYEKRRCFIWISFLVAMKPLYVGNFMG